MQGVFNELNTDASYSLVQGGFNYAGNTYYGSDRTFLQGYRNRSTGRYNFAQGASNYIIGPNPYGGPTPTYCFAQGHGNTVNARRTAFAQGRSNTITSASRYAFAQGDSNYVYGYYAFAQGWYNKSGAGSTGCTFAQGRQNTASGEYTFAQGGSNYATDNVEFVQGQGNRANDRYQLVQGRGCRAYRDRSFTQGFFNANYGYDSFSQGSYCYAYSNYAFAQGRFCRAVAYGSFAQGYSCTVYSPASFCQGRVSTVVGGGSAVFAQGYSVSARGVNSFFQGRSLTPAGTYSNCFAQGYELETAADRVFVQGVYGLVTRDDQKTWTSNRTGTKGAAQSSRLIKYVRTTDATETTLATLGMDINKSYAINVKVICKNKNVDGEAAAFEHQGALALRDSAGSTLIGGPISLTKTDTGQDPGPGNASFVSTLKISGTSVLLTVTADDGDASGNDYEWCCDFHFVEVEDAA